MDCTLWWLWDCFPITYVMLLLFLMTMMWCLWLNFGLEDDWMLVVGCWISFSALKVWAAWALVDATIDSIRRIMRYWWYWIMYILSITLSRLESILTINNGRSNLIKTRAATFRFWLTPSVPASVSPIVAGDGLNS